MKTISFLIITLLITVSVGVQSLLDIYKSETVQLIPDSEFAQDNNRDQIFREYHNKIGKEQVGNRKSISLLLDGSFLVNYAYQNYFSIFSEDGSFVKEFSIKNEAGKTLQTPNIVGVLNNEILYTGVDNTGNMFCTDLNGKLVKKLEVNYMVKNIIPLPNSKFAIVGIVLWKSRIRDIVAIKDYETGDERVIWESFSPRGKMVETDIKDKNGEYIKTYSPPSPPSKQGIVNIVLTDKNELLVCNANTVELLYCDLEGNFKRTKEVNWENNKVPVEEILKILDETRVRIANREINDKMIERFGSEERAKRYIEELLKQHDTRRDKIQAPMDLPYYSTIMEDSDNNTLFFEYGKRGVKINLMYTL